jgi:uncharacterized membrane protein
MGRPSDQDIDVSVAALLRFGITLSSLVALAGGLIYLRHPWAAATNYTQFHAPGPSLQTIGGILRGVRSGRADCIIQLGLVLLILTPVARVVFCVAGFVRQRDRLYVLISLFVLGVLLYSLLAGAR